MKNLLPNATDDFRRLNPHLFTSGDVQGNVARPRGIRKAYETAHHSKLSHSESKRNQTPALGGAVSGKAEGVHRIIVRFVGFRTRPLDPDNFAAGCKDLLDGLRHSALIPGDEAWTIDFQTRQEKVSHHWQEKTVIEIET